MAADPCLIDFSSIDPSCEAFAKPGGVYPFLYVGRKSEIASFTRGTDGTITAVTLKTSASLRKFTSRKFQNAGSYPLKKSDTGRTTFTHTVTDRIYHSTQEDRNTLVGLALAEDLVFFVPTNAGQVEVYGEKLGLTATAGAGGTGTKLDDDSTYLYTFTGDEPLVPSLMQTASVTGPPALTGIDATLAYLDALVAA